MSPAELQHLIAEPPRVVRRCAIPGEGNLTEDQYYVLAHYFRWGSDGYPVVKRGARWFVDGQRGIGGYPCVFKTKGEASAAWSAFIDLLIDYKSGRLPNPSLYGVPYG